MEVAKPSKHAQGACWTCNAKWRELWGTRLGATGATFRGEPCQGCAHLQRGGDVGGHIIEEQRVLEGHPGRQQRADVEAGVVEAAVQDGLHDLHGVELTVLLTQLLPVLCQVEGACMAQAQFGCFNFRIFLGALERVFNTLGCRSGWPAWLLTGDS